MKIIVAALVPIILLTACSTTHKLATTSANPNSTTASDHNPMLQHAETITRENREDFNKFYQNVQNGIQDNIRVIEHTVEGEPMYYDFKFDGKKLEYSYDHTQDKFSSPQNRVKKSTSCASLQKKDATYAEGRLFEEYTLKSCEDEKNERI